MSKNNKQKIDFYFITIFDRRLLKDCSRDVLSVWRFWLFWSNSHDALSCLAVEWFSGWVVEQVPFVLSWSHQVVELWQSDLQLSLIEWIRFITSTRFLPNCSFRILLLLYSNFTPLFYLRHSVFSTRPFTSLSISSQILHISFSVLLLYHTPMKYKHRGINFQVKKVDNDCWQHSSCSSHNSLHFPMHFWCEFYCLSDWTVRK